MLGGDDYTGGLSGGLLGGDGLSGGLSGGGFLGGDNLSGGLSGGSLLGGDNMSGGFSGGSLLGGRDMPTGRSMLGEDRESGKFDYRTLPNKMLELVKNVGNMKQEGTGYFADSESEMLTVLAYLNFGETTGTTESMREQIDDAVKALEERKLGERDEADKTLLTSEEKNNNFDWF